MSEEVKNYEMVNHPAHYNNYDVEVIDMINRIWGIDAAILWCEITAFKYRMRMGTKPGNSIEQDLTKEKWYLNKKDELTKELDINIDEWTENSYILDVSKNNKDVEKTTNPIVSDKVETPLFSTTTTQEYITVNKEN